MLGLLQARRRATRGAVNLSVDALRFPHEKNLFQSGKVSGIRDTPALVRSQSNPSSGLAGIVRSTCYAAFPPQMSVATVRDLVPRVQRFQ